MTAKNTPKAASHQKIKHKQWENKISDIMWKEPKIRPPQWGDTDNLDAEVSKWKWRLSIIVTL